MKYEYDKKEILDLLTYHIERVYKGELSKQYFVIYALSHPCIAELLMEETRLENLEYDHFIKLIESILEKES